MQYLKNAQEYPAYDVIVAGGGPAGIGAGIASARCGMKTLIVEMNGSLGGVSTCGALPFFLGAYTGSQPFRTMLEKGLKYSELPRNHRAVAGIFEEMTQKLVAEKMAVGPGVIAGTDRYPGLDRLGCHDELTFDIEAGKRVFDEMAIQSGCDILYYTQCFDTVVENGIVKGIYVVNKSGLTYIPCKVLIDCTGDADLVYSAGYQTYKGDRVTGEMTHASLICHIENIDSGSIEAFLSNGGDPWFTEICQKAQEENPDIELPKRLIMFPMVQDGVYMVNGGMSIHGIDGTSAEDRTRLTLWGRERAKVLTEILFRKYMPGAENCRLRLTAYYPGIRETRRIVGEQTLTEDLILSPECFKDSIAVAGRHFDLGRVGFSQPFAKKKLPFGAAGIPYGALIPKDSNNIIVAGRCIAADGQALGPARIMSTCMAVGQAAGTAASMAVKNNCSLKAVDVDLLRQKLRSDGAIVDLTN